MVDLPEKAPGVQGFPELFQGEDRVRLLESLCKGVDRFTDRSGKTFSWLVLGLMGLSVMEVTLRNVFGAPTIWSHEILSYLFGSHWVLPLAFTLLYKAHVNVDFITMRYSKKAQAIIEIVNFCLFLGVICVVWPWQGTLYAAKAWGIMERCPSAFNSPLYPAKTVLPIGFAFLAVQAIRDLIGNIVFVVKGVRI